MGVAKASSSEHAYLAYDLAEKNSRELHLGWSGEHARGGGNSGFSSMLKHYQERRTAQGAAATGGARPNRCVFAMAGGGDHGQVIYLTAVTRLWDVSVRIIYLNQGYGFTRLGVQMQTFVL